MSLTKEEYLNSYESIENGYYNGSDVLNFKKLIEEHYELLKSYEMAMNDLNRRWEIEYDNPPLKFEELKPDMWVWDNGYKEWCYIYFIGGKYPHRKYIDNCESDGEFEENRFYRKQV